MKPRKKALVLSGGGGRGAYHVGVIEALVERGWMEDGKGPDIIAGTSIGAINAAALASGLAVTTLRERWLAMHTESVHRLSNFLPAAVRPIMRFLLHSVLTSEGGSPSSVPAPAPPDEDMSAGGLITRLNALFRSRPFRGLLDNTPWEYTLSEWMDFERINSLDAPALLLAATDVQHGTLRIFSNRQLNNRPPDTITMKHLLASASIPVVYPWTPIDDNNYWDGAVLANTPLGAVTDMAGADDVEILVVMMTPWHEDPALQQEQIRQLPQDMVQSLALTLDWALLASYRTTLKLMQSYNALVEATEKLERAALQTGDASFRMTRQSNRVLRRVSLPTVIAPQDFMPLEWIVDYEIANHQKLFAQGKADAERILDNRPGL